MNEDFYYDDNQMYNFEKKPEELKTGLAVASFVISLVNFIFCGLMLSFISAPISIIMGIVSLVKKRGGKVVFSVVDSIGNVDVEQCRKIAEKLGIPLRVRVKE